MKIKRLVCMLLILCLTAAFALPVSGQEAAGDSEPITERAFAALVRDAFPGCRSDILSDDETILTWERALAALCGALGVSGTAAENLAFAIEGDLLPGVVYAAGGR